LKFGFDSTKLHIQSLVDGRFLDVDGNVDAPLTPVGVWF